MNYSIMLPLTHFWNSAITGVKMKVADRVKLSEAGWWGSRMVGRWDGGMAGQRNREAAGWKGGGGVDGRATRWWDSWLVG